MSTALLDAITAHQRCRDQIKLDILSSVLSLAETYQQINHRYNRDGTVAGYKVTGPADQPVVMVYEDCIVIFGLLLSDGSEEKVKVEVPTAAIWWKLDELVMINQLKALEREVRKLELVRAAVTAVWIPF